MPIVRQTNITFLPLTFVMAMAVAMMSVMLLLTDKELERASKRAEKNKEDLPKHFAIALKVRNEESDVLDDTMWHSSKKVQRIHSSGMGG